jgi:hypothetical protein
MHLFFALTLFFVRYLFLSVVEITQGVGRQHRFRLCEGERDVQRVLPAVRGAPQSLPTEEKSPGTTQNGFQLRNVGSSNVGFWHFYF